jgi:hypothetical protein
MQQTRKHFQCSGFAGAVRAEEPDEFTGSNREIDILDGESLLVLAMEQSANRAAKTRLLFVSAKGLG